MGTGIAYEEHCGKYIEVDKLSIITKEKQLKLKQSNITVYCPDGTDSLSKKYTHQLASKIAKFEM